MGGMVQSERPMRMPDDYERRTSEYLQTLEVPRHIGLRLPV